MTVAIVYASTHGHTGKIVGRMADIVRAEGLDVDGVEIGETAAATSRSWSSSQDGTATCFKTDRPRSSR